jgi:hypothetical protein
MTILPPPSPQVDERVWLKMDIPELGLRCGEAGVVCSMWFSPATAYEVEFREPPLNYPIRALLLGNQIQSDAKARAQADA